MISINRFKDIHKSNNGYPKFSMIFGYPKMHLMISKNAFMDTLKSIYGYPKFELWISKNRIMDIQKSNYGYPKIHMI